MDKHLLHHMNCVAHEWTHNKDCKTLSLHYIPLPPHHGLEAFVLDEVSPSLLSPRPCEILVYNPVSLE